MLTLEYALESKYEIYSSRGLVTAGPCLSLGRHFFYWVFNLLFGLNEQGEPRRLLAEPLELYFDSFSLTRIGVVLDKT